MLYPVCSILRSLTSSFAVSEALRLTVTSSTAAASVPSNVAAAPDSETACSVIDRHLGAFGTARIGLLADAQGLVLDLGAELGGIGAFGVVYDFRGSVSGTRTNLTSRSASTATASKVAATALRPAPAAPAVSCA